MAQLVDNRSELFKYLKRAALDIVAKAEKDGKPAPTTPGGNSITDEKWLRRLQNKIKKQNDMTKGRTKEEMTIKKEKTEDAIEEGVDGEDLIKYDTPPEVAGEIESQNPNRTRMTQLLDTENWIDVPEFTSTTEGEACPNCGHKIEEVVENNEGDIECPSCGTLFEKDDESGEMRVTGTKIKQIQGFKHVWKPSVGTHERKKGENQIAISRFSAGIGHRSSKLPHFYRREEYQVEDDTEFKNNSKYLKFETLREKNDDNVTPIQREINFKSDGIPYEPEKAGHDDMAGRYLSLSMPDVDAHLTEFKVYKKVHRRDEEENIVRTKIQPLGENDNYIKLYYDRDTQTYQILNTKTNDESVYIAQMTAYSKAGKRPDKDTAVPRSWAWYSRIDPDLTIGQNRELFENVTGDESSQEYYDNYFDNLELPEDRRVHDYINDAGIIITNDSTGLLDYLYILKDDNELDNTPLKDIIPRIDNYCNYSLEILGNRAEYTKEQQKAGCWKPKKSPEDVMFDSMYNRRGVCHLRGLAFMLMCGYLGIPARVGISTVHAWGEFWIGRTVEQDGTKMSWNNPEQVRNGWLTVDLGGCTGNETRPENAKSKKKKAKKGQGSGQYMIEIDIAEAENMYEPVFTKTMSHDTLRKYFGENASDDLITKIYLELMKLKNENPDNARRVWEALEKRFEQEKESEGD